MNKPNVSKHDNKYRAWMDGIYTKLNTTNIKLINILGFLIYTSAIVNTKNFIFFCMNASHQKKMEYTSSAIPDTIGLYTNIKTKDIVSLIKMNIGGKEIPDALSYGSVSDNCIDISFYKKLLATDSLLLLKDIEGDYISRSLGISDYCEKDYYKYKSLLQKISSDWIKIEEKDSYWDKVAKIQQFVCGLEYESDILYLGEKGTLPVMSNYQCGILLRNAHMAKVSQFYTMKKFIRSGIFEYFSWLFV